MRPNPMRIGALALCGLLACGAAEATVQPRETNIVELVGKSELILRGTVKSVSDGIDARGLPYTEVTLHVDEAIRGPVGSEYTFRQFGLLEAAPHGQWPHQPDGDARRLDDVHARRGNDPVPVQAREVHRAADDRRPRPRKVQGCAGAAPATAPTTPACSLT